MDASRRPAPDPLRWSPAETATLIVLAACGVILAAWLVSWAADRARTPADVERVSPPASLLDEVTGSDEA